MTQNHHSKWKWKRKEKFYSIMVTATTEKKRQENGIFKRDFQCFKTKTWIRRNVFIFIFPVNLTQMLLIVILRIFLNKYLITFSWSFETLHQFIANDWYPASTFFINTTSLKNLRPKYLDILTPCCWVAIFFETAFVFSLV